MSITVKTTCFKQDPKNRMKNGCERKVHENLPSADTKCPRNIIRDFSFENVNA